MTSLKKEQIRIQK